jgi:TetR/AcrR family transcriptional regulator
MVDKRAAGGRRRRDPEATQQALLAAATELFAERGYDGVALSAIADSAGVNKAMVSYHFGGKRKLYLAIITATFADLVARAEKLPASNRPAPDVLRDLIALVAETAMGRNRHFPVIMLREVLAGGRHLGAATLRYPLRVANVVRQIVERGVQEGSFRPVDPLLTHLSLVGSLLFFHATAPFRERLRREGWLPGTAPDASRYVEHMQDLLVGGLAARRHRRARAGRTAS